MKRIPDFVSEQEEVTWWQTQDDWLQYFDQRRTVRGARFLRRLSFMARVRSALGILFPNWRRVA